MSTPSLRGLLAALALAVASLAASPGHALAQAPHDERYQRLFAEGIDLLEKGRFDDSVKRFQAAIELDPASPDAYYNIACAYSKKGDKPKAIDWLEKSLDKGFDDAAHIDKDADLDAIRGERRFLEVMAKRFGRALPGEALTTLKGDVASLEKLKGKVVLVCFWRSWVEPCKTEMAALNALQKAWAEKGLVIVGISSEEAAVQEQVADENKVAYTLLREAGPLPAPMENVRAFPTKFVLDREGKVVKRFLGAREQAELETILEPFLEATKKKPEPEVF